MTITNDDSRLTTKCLDDVPNADRASGTHATKFSEADSRKSGLTCRFVVVDECRRAGDPGVHGGMKVYRGSAAAARSYVEADRSRVDDYYLAEGTGLATRYVVTPGEIFASVPRSTITPVMLQPCA